MEIIEIKSAESIFGLFLKYRKSTVYTFRGQSDADWELIPKAGRPPLNNRDDKQLFIQWKRRAVAYLKKDYSDWELLAIANHTGVPTRLLDWSLNPLVATFFASLENYDKDGAVYVCKASSHLPTLSTDPFNLENKSIHFIQPSSSSDRIINQFGYFTIHTKPDFKFTDKTQYGPLDKIIIPKTIKKEIIFVLNQFGINNLTIFPDLDGLARHLNWFYCNYEYWDGNVDLPGPKPAFG